VSDATLTINYQRFLILRLSLGEIKRGKKITNKNKITALLKIKTDIIASVVKSPVEGAAIIMIRRFEDTKAKGVIRIRKSKNRLHNGQTKNNDQQNSGTHRVTLVTNPVIMNEERTGKCL
jgi:hypothetical protein